MGLSNLVVLPLIAVFLKERGISAKLLGIAAFMLVGCESQNAKHARIFHGMMGMACLLTMIACVVLFLYPYDLNFAYYYKIDLFGAL